MLNDAKEILEFLNKNNYQAYIVGGFVRDKLLGIESFDIDITTDATPKEIKELFDNIVIFDEYGAVKLNYKNNIYDVTTLRKDIEYGINRKDLKIEYTSNIEDDIKRRDFTINSLYMDKDENIIDLYNGIDDINNKIIKVKGNISKKIKEDPIRILRALRYSIKLDFTIENNLYNEIKNNINLLSNLSFYRKKEELDKIFMINKISKINELFYNLNISKSLEIELSDKIVYTTQTIGIWAQIVFSDNYPFTKLEKQTINNIRSIINDNKIDNYTVYKYGSYASEIAGEILNIDKKSIDEIHNNLAIYDQKDIMISFNEISHIICNDDVNLIKEIISKLEEEIVYGRLNNTKEDIINYIREVIM